MRAEYLFEVYFSNRITPDEQKELDALLASDGELRDEFNFQLEIRAAVRKKERSRLKAKLQRLELKSERNVNLQWWAIAASIVVIIGMAWYFGNYSNQKDYNQLYATHFKVYPNVVAPLERSQAGESSELMKNAFRNYENEAYEEAYVSFQEIHENEGAEYAFFYATVSLMANEKYTEVIERFGSRQEWDNADFESAAKWYLALAYLKNGDEKNATKYLEELRNADHSLNHSARELLRDLE